MKQTSYWLDTAPPGDDYADLPLPEAADVVVVGGGLTGLSAAIHLARKGASVVLLEQHRPSTNSWREVPWPAVPGHFGRPWFLPLAGAYYRLKDVLT
jgi:glycine/D-amino acid oxidase-like deaminating enzyme